MNRTFDSVSTAPLVFFEDFWKNEGKKAFLEKSLFMTLEYSFQSEDSTLGEKLFTKDFVNTSISLALRSFYGALGSAKFFPSIKDFTKDKHQVTIGIDYNHAKEVWTALAILGSVKEVPIKIKLLSLREDNESLDINV